jgi:Ca2+-transporting ATPase
MQRMARRKALVRSMRAIEDVGLVTTVATDKTGTLTKNQLRVQDEWQPSSVEKSTYFGELVALSANAGGGEIHDPLDATMVAHSQPGANPGARKLVRQLPFELSLALSGNVWRDGQEYLVAVKGSPEAVLALCRLGGQAEEQAMGMVGQLASHGYRVVALAETRTAHQVAGLGTLPRTGWHFGGLLALADELRPEAEDAVRRAHEAGIKVVMITGDHADTAYAIGKTLGLVDSRDQVVDSRQFSDKSDDELHDIIRGVRVFARVVPESKYRILELLKRDEITAMTGDGVNDVPALTKADVGVAMGSGSQLAREAGDIILLDDNFSSLVRGIGEGRAIVSNIRKMLVYLLATNAGEVLTMMGALVVGLPLPVVAVQVLWINLVTDTTMVIPLGVEPAERDTMRKPPRPADAPILDGYMVGRIAVIATVMATLTLVIFGYFLQRNGLDYARTVAFYVLAVAQWASALSARSETRSALSMIGVRSLAFWGGLVLAVGLQVLAMVGPLAAALHTVSVRPDDLAIVSLLGIAVPIITADVLKVLLRSRAR